MPLSEELKASDVGLEFLTGELKGSHDPAGMVFTVLAAMSGMVFTVLAAMSGMEREYIQTASSKATNPPAGAARPSAARASPTSRCCPWPLPLRDQEMSLCDITRRVVITTGVQKGQHPSPATVMRMLREHDEQAATAVISTAPGVDYLMVSTELVAQGYAHITPDSWPRWNDEPPPVQRARDRRG